MLRFIQRNPEPFDRKAAEALLPDYTGLQARLLYSRGVKTRQQAWDFLHPSLSGLHDPLLLSDMDKAIQFIQLAREKGWKTIVFGDYDADGVCASVLMAEALEKFGLKADIVSALRKEGYGLNNAAVDRLHQAGCRLLITVDLGITNVSEVAYAKELGMCVIVTDHHGLGLKKCPADAVINPLLGEYPFRFLCGTGVAFKVAQQLLGLEDCMDLLDLVALATVADLVPLQDENRILVTFGLKQISARHRPGLKALLDVSQVGETVTSTDLGFRLGPRLNSAGRLGSAEPAVQLLRAVDPEDAAELAQALDETNRQRKSAESLVTSHAEKLISQHDFALEPALLLRGEDWLPGVVGLTAGKLTQKYFCPSGVFTREGDILVGSFRSVSGLNVHDCLQACDDLLLRHGGHELAGGASLLPENFEAFSQRFQQEARRSDPRNFLPTQEYDVPVTLEDCNETLFAQIQEMEPFGLGNPSPLFLAENVRVADARAVGDGSHLKLRLAQGKSIMDGIGFGLGEKLHGLANQIHCVFSLDKNTYRGVTSLQLQVKTISSADPQSLSGAGEEEVTVSLLESLRDMGTETSLGLDCKTEDWADLTASFSQTLRGQLLLSRTPETFQKALALFPDLDCVSGSAADVCCLPTLVFRPVLSPSLGCWKHIWLLDGELLPGETCLWQKLYPQAVIHALPSSKQKAELLHQANPSLEELRLLWILAHEEPKRNQLLSKLPPDLRAKELPFSRQYAGHLALCETGWLNFAGAYFPAKGDVSPDTAPFLQVLLKANDSVRNVL